MQKKFIWSEKYSVNVTEIDEQHKQFFKICNELIGLANSESFSDEEALIAAGRLGGYAFYHLDTEEALFIKTKYPDTSLHKEAHDKFRKEVEVLINEVRDENTDTKEAIKKVSNFSGDWLLEHILIEDQKYSKWFNDHGINGGS